MPHQPDAHHQLALELARDVAREPAGVACGGQRRTCLDRAADHAKRGYRAGSARTGILEARILTERGQPLEAEEHLARTCEQLPGDLACNEALVAQALANDSPRLPSAVKALVAVACNNRERCGRAHLTLGNRFAQAGQWHVALTHYRHAAEEAPSAQAWQALARAAEHVGQESVALEARRRVGLAKAADEQLTRPFATESPSAIPLPPDDDPAVQRLDEGGHPVEAPQ